MESWQFIESPGGGWYWLCSDVLSRRTRTSAATFATRTECMADAMQSGYPKMSASGGFAAKHTARQRRQKRA